MLILIAPYSNKLATGHTNPKNYPYLKDLIKLLGDHEIIQVGLKGEEVLTEKTLFNKPFSTIEKALIKCDTFIAVDTWLQHAAHYVGKKGNVLWGKSDPLLFGYPENNNILKDRKYLRTFQLQTWMQCEFDINDWLSAEEVYSRLIF